MGLSSWFGLGVVLWRSASKLRCFKAQGCKLPVVFKGLKRWDEGRWDIGNKLQYSRVCTKDPLTHLPLHPTLLSPLFFEAFVGLLTHAQEVLE